MSSPKARFRDGFLTVKDGIRLHYRDYPGPLQGPPLLCLPGLTRNARDFAEFAERMSPRFRVLSFEFRGRGESGHDPEPQRYLPITYAHDTIALLDHVGVAEAVFVGTSLGGIVTMLIAVLDEDRIAAAILNDVGPEVDESGLERIRNYVGRGTAGFSTWAEAAAAVRAYQGGLPGSWSEEQWQALARRLSSERGDGVIHLDYDPAIAEPFRNSSAPINMWPMFDALACKPVLVLRGEHSDLLTPECLAAMDSRSPNVITVTVPGMPHPPELTEPEAVAAIDAFLAEVDPG
jgi:pimeloyl-ACP methyl ester carboxylesterase